MDVRKTFKIILILIALFLVLNMIYVGYGKIQCNRMIDAIENNDITELESILKFANPNCVTDTTIGAMLGQKAQHTPLGEACNAGNFEMVKLLIENGADVNYVPRYTLNTPLSFAVQSRSVDNFKIVKLLIENGADVNFRRGYQAIPICAALPVSGSSRPNAMEILEFLLESGADCEKEEALSAACYDKDEKMIRYLVEKRGYDASDPNCIVSYCYGFGECSYETFEYLLERGANPYEKYRINDYIGEKSAVQCLMEKSFEDAGKLIELAKKYGYEE